MLVECHLNCFNPCFIGTYSFTIFNLHKYNILDIVLILVLLELILLPEKSLSKSKKLYSFNPCFIGTYSFTVYHTEHKNIDF